MLGAMCRVVVLCLSTVLVCSCRVIHLADNVGASVARNLAAASATTKYVMFFDDDDDMMPRCIETLLVVAETTGAHVVTSWVQVRRCLVGVVAWCMCERVSLADFRGVVPVDPCAPQRYQSSFSPEGVPTRRTLDVWAPSGLPGAAMFINAFGGGSGLHRRDVFLKSGGYVQQHHTRCWFASWLVGTLTRCPPTGIGRRQGAQHTWTTNSTLARCTPKACALWWCRSRCTPTRCAHGAASTSPATAATPTGCTR